ncbi:MAG: NERD domain-containing protein/DEAD/DEAH box helicase, partial [Rhodocyclaceae bacterium]|nr:NERD domain-containing protein/DEAD/DEAH box helicase [Rhodocyclaceae bacterium]
MAQIIPAGWRQLAAAGGVRRELQTLSVLERELPDSYTVYHGVHWTRVDGRHSIFGEVDFVILNAAGKILLVEQKSGMLSETPDGLFKRYGDKTKSVRVQMARTADQLQYKFSQDGKAGKVLIELLLYCPHYEVKNPAAAGIDPERIVDSQKRPFLGHIIRNILPDEAADPAAHERVHKFLVGELDLVADVSVLAGDAGCLYRRMSGGLATWARQIECEPQRLRIVGTAGSGKTQLALAVFQDALDGGKRPLYVCFNRPLADHIARIVGGRGVVSTYHQLCDRMLTAAGRKPHFDMPDAFARMEHQFAALDPDAASLFDVLIVDEGQDFSEPWRDALLRWLKPGGAVWWMEDPMQNLYGRPALPLPGWVSLHSRTNYRSPHEILRYLN